MSDYEPMYNMECEVVRKELFDMESDVHEEEDTENMRHDAERDDDDDG